MSSTHWWIRKACPPPPTPILFTPANEVWGKVIFFHLFAILFTGGVCLSACWDTTLPRDHARPPQDQAPSLDQAPRHRVCWEIRSTCGRYASYWNAILLVFFQFLRENGRCSFQSSLSVMLVVSGAQVYLHVKICT